MELPLGFGMALCQNASAAEYFYSLTGPQQEAIVDRCKDIKSSDEMHAYVSRLKDGRSEHISIE
jgi:hypothetical protein